MTCNGCKTTVEKALSSVDGVQEVLVNLEKGEAVIEMQDHIPLRKFQQALEAHGGHYNISLPGDTDVVKHHASVKEKRDRNTAKGKGMYYCPMHCEGEKSYNQAGDCPVCGMDLVEEVTHSQITGTQYTCPMHPEIIRDKPGPCPICGMDLIPKEVDESAESNAYKVLSGKFRIAVVFTIPIFLIAMSEMISDNPLYDLMSQKYWNWIQFGLSLPVVFYATWMFFERAYRSVKTWNLNMFTLIGIGAGVAWIFSLVGMLFPNFFPEQFKTEAGTVHIYFEAATVILTLVLLGQLLETRAHHRTNSAVKELLKLAPNNAVRIVNGVDEVVSLDQIKSRGSASC